jgi:hypothetical protein
MVDKKYHNVMCSQTRDYFAILRDNEGELVAQAQFGDRTSYEDARKNTIKAYDNGRISGEEFLMFKDVVSEMFSNDLILEIVDIIDD